MKPTSFAASDDPRAVAESNNRIRGGRSTVPPLVLPFARPSEPGRPFQVASVGVSLAPDTQRQLLQAARDPALFFLAAWSVLLWRFTDQSEFVIGCVGDDCSRDAAAARMFPIKVTFVGETSFNDVARQVESALAAAKQSLCDGVETAFSAAFCIEKTGGSTETLPVWAGFQLMLRLRRVDASWIADLLYDAGSLPRDSVERMSRSLTALLLGAAKDPSSAAYALPILSEEDHHQVTVAFNQTASSYPADKCIHELFEEQVEKWPDRVALRDRKQALTYRQLNDHANRLAHFLRRQGAKPNVPVALYVERSAEMIIGLLAILKAGACYVPLIPADPAARVAGQIAEAKPPILLAEQRLVHSLPEYDGEVVCLDQSFEGESASNLKLRTTSEDLVYVLYTSGSTGIPKGVAVRHRNLVNYTYFICRQLGLQDFPEGWHFATVSTLAADLGNTSVFGALTSGGCLHVIDFETAMSPGLFAAYAAKHPIDLLKIAPSHLAALLQGSAGNEVLPKRFVVVGGERLTWELLQEIRKRGTCCVINHYGPTETTVGCCTLIVHEEAFAKWRPATIPLGRPIANDQVYILDRRLQPVPVGVAGELHMSGAGLSRGYINQPEQTTERFIAHPFSRNSSDRLYRTGDLGRFLPDGTIEFLGRTDHQVKIRGFRVEPAELEAALKRHPEIRQAVAVPEENQHGERALVAYVASAEALQEDDLRAFLSRQIPDYMLPARVAVLDDLPLNANGKIDLRALPKLSRKSSRQGKLPVSPCNPDEEKLTAIWAEVLGLDRVGVDENFFALGGHSLLAIQIVARIRRVFSIDFPLRALLESPTVSAISARLGEFQRRIENEDEEIARLLREMDSTSEEEAERLLASETEGKKD